MGKLSRRKGGDFEREVARRFAGVFKHEGVRRGLQFRDGAECPDVVTPLLWVECKRGRRTNPRAALAQAIADSKGQRLIPVAVCKDDFEEPFVVLTLDAFSELVAQCWAARKEGSTYVV
jgi:hypothetical protein